MLSKRQHRILQFVHYHIEDNGFAPSLREIAQAETISTVSVVNYHLERMVTLGYLKKSRGKSRSTTLIEQGLALVGPTQSAKIERMSKKSVVHGLPDIIPPDEITNRLREENRRLKAENERLCRERQRQVNALQKQVLFLADELHQLQRASEYSPA